MPWFTPLMTGVAIAIGGAAQLTAPPLVADWLGTGVGAPERCALVLPGRIEMPWFTPLMTGVAVAIGGAAQLTAPPLVAA